MQRHHKILHIITGLSTGGAENALYNLLKGGLCEKYQNLIISLKDHGTMSDPIKRLGIPTISLGLSTKTPNIPSLLKLYNQTRLFQPDIIQGWMYHGNLTSIIASFVLRPKPILIWNVRHSIYNLFDEKIMTRQVIRANCFLSKLPQAIIYNSQIARKQHELLGFCSTKGLVIANGIDISRFSFSLTARKRIRNELAIPMSAVVIGHVARFHPVKDHSTFLKAAVHLAKQYPNLYFILCGRNVERRNKALTKFVPKKLMGRFRLLGERSDIEALMSSMDIFSSSSYGEGWPNVIGEAMAIGLPCVATNVGDAANIIGNTGIIVAPRDHKALVCAINSLLTMPKQRLIDLGNRARFRIEKKYKLPMITKQYIDLYDHLIRKKTSN